MKRIFRKLGRSGRSVVVQAAVVFFLGQGFFPGLSIAQSRPGAAQVLAPQEFKAKLKGPILSFPTPFTEDYEIDYAGVKMLIDRAIQYGCEIVALTSGNSKYDRLSYEEVRQLTRFVVETVHGRALTIAATGPWDRYDVMDYVQYAEFLGASAVQVSRPADLEGSDDVEAVTAFYKDVAAHTKLGIVLHGFYSVDLLNELVKIPSVVAMKEDVDYPYYATRQIMFGDRLAIFGGGNDGRYLHGYPYGSPAYYSTLYTYAPEYGRKFWEAIQRKDMKAATEILLKYDFPFISQFSPALWQAAIAYSGGPARYIRPKQETLSEAKMDDMRKLFSDMGLPPAWTVRTQVTTGPALPKDKARGGHIGGAIGGQVLIAGGNNWSLDKTQKHWLKDAMIYRNGAWEEGPALPSPVAYAMYDNDEEGLYYAGGTSDGKAASRQAYVLQSPEGPWKPLPALPAGMHSGAGAILDGKFYVACGSNGKSHLNSMYVLDLKDLKKGWKACPSLPGAPRIFPMLVACGGQLYLYGGLSADGPQGDFYRFSPEQHAWTRLDDLSLKGYAWAGRSIDSTHILVAGRADNSKPFAIHKDVWVIDLTDMSIRKTGEMTNPTTTAPLVETKDNEWWLIGGEPDGNLNRSERVSIIEASAEH